MNKTNKISSIIIAKNEEENIARCIESLSTISDDIIVIVDSTTSDSTYEIACSYNDTNVEIKDWSGFSKTKEYALTKTKYEWIFWIDADEAATNELCDEINLLELNSAKTMGYFIARRAYFLGKWIKHSGWYPGYVLRLFNKNSAKFSDSDVHEHVVINGKTSKLNNDLEHFTYPNITDYFNRLNNYTSLAAEEIYSSDKKVTMMDLCTRPVFIFIKMYIIKLGFLDGFRGLLLAIFSSNYVFFKYSKVWEQKIKVLKK